MIGAYILIVAVYLAFGALYLLGHGILIPRGVIANAEGDVWFAACVLWPLVFAATLFVAVCKLLALAWEEL